MNHKEKMEYLKQHDPMLFYELNSDPTGGVDIDFLWLGFTITAIITISLILYFI